MVEIARITTLIADLMQTYRQALAVKHIHDERVFRKVLCCDYEKILHALVELKSVNLPDLLNTTFFPTSPSITQALLTKAKFLHLNHIGFEVLEPLDLILQGIDYWVEHLNKNLGFAVNVQKYLRFPASQNFQNRVNAYTEIMCIWLQIEEQNFMLEFFDIARSHATLLPNKTDMIYHISPERLLTHHSQSRHHEEAMKSLFGNDSIWHYSMSLQERDAVNELHQQLASFSLTHTDYKMAYANPIENIHDGTYHTKIINIPLKLELELCHLSPVCNQPTLL